MTTPRVPSAEELAAGIVDRWQDDTTQAVGLIRADRNAVLEAAAEVVKQKCRTPLIWKLFDEGEANTAAKVFEDAIRALKEDP